MNFHEAEAYLLSLGNEVETMKLGLDNIRKLLDALGNPQNKYLKVQVAGTNGKGSVCAFLDSICREAGIETGVFTSPHLVSITERVRINGVDVSEADFARYSTVVRDMAERMVARAELENTPTFFEQLTAIALLAFADANVDLAILETGLGGRLDATTAANAEIAAITRIDLDHQEYLGDTLAKIAAEKAAIIHNDSKVVIGKQPAEAIPVLLSACANYNVVPLMAENITVTDRLGLAGRHQFENARTVVGIVRQINENFKITEQHVSDGLENARHPGRLERVDRFLFDGAHNIAGAKALRAYLDEFIDQPITLVFGAMKRKDVAEMARQLFPSAESIVLAEIDSTRAMQPSDILKACDRELWRRKVVDVGQGRQIVEKAKQLAGANGVILVTGSLYLVGEMKKLLGSRI